MKKSMIIIFLSLIVLSMFFISAQTNTTLTNVESNGYSCVNSIINTKKCTGLSTEEKIFAVLATGKCRNELVAEVDEEGCWPEENCRVKLTAQAALGLKHTNANIDKYYNWLSEHKKDFEGIDWFIQVETPEQSACHVEYGGSSFDFTINADKTITGDGGTCLVRYPIVGNSYWFQVRPTCYNNNFTISCDGSFLTSLIYRKSGGETFYVLSQTQSASGGGTTIEKLRSSCFTDTIGGLCTYEGTLWAAIVMKYLGYTDTSYLPYLIAWSDENSRLIPESFLYTLTDNMKVELVAKQKESKYWAESGDRFYDTAVALLPFQNEEVLEKTNAKKWLVEMQGTDGCWQGNLKNTAFILYSVWPRKIAVEDGGTTGGKDCPSSGFHCMSAAACGTATGEQLSNFTGCFGTSICCSKAKPLDSCAVQGGDLCNTGMNEECLGGTVISSSDSNSEKICCIQGTCGVKQASQCVIQGGSCRSSCISGEKISPYSCNSSDVCCVEKKGGGIWIIIILIILIILVVLGIIFRKQLKPVFDKIKGWFQKTFAKIFKKKGTAVRPATGAPRFPMAPSTRTVPGAVPRRIVPSSARPAQAAARPAPAKKTEFDDVLKKLKEIGK